MSPDTFRSFWQMLPSPIVGLAPMDGVTDAAFRFISAKHGKPDLIFTEFTHVEGICRGIPAVLRHLEYDEIERPVIAQIFGHEPAAFYKAAHIIGTLGFDGLDINMGCPDRAIAAQGCGAALIQKPKQAQEIIRAAQAGVRDFADGRALSEIGLPETTHQAIQQMAQRMGMAGLPRRHLPVSVKTRLGYDRVVIESWLCHLLEMAPAAITLHGRTLTQGYRGSADWEAIGRAVVLAHMTPTLLLGNGDILSPEEASDRIRQYGVDGVLIGRGAMGNPWFFRSNDTIRARSRPPSEFQILPPPTPFETDRVNRWQVAMEHAALFDRIRGNVPFSVIRKQLGWYAKGKEAISGLRSKLVQVSSLEDVQITLTELLAF